MIYGIGTDIVRIARIEASVSRTGERFAEKILGPDEMAVYLDRNAKVAARGLRFLATRFAAKEAFSKAIGLGMTTPMTWHSMQVLNAASGQPVAVCSGALQTWMEERGLSARVSISDETDYAVAFVIVEQTPPKPEA
jgi:holo-[acyl-carrier protein] synthase